jgi:hypothetical protein
MIAIHTTPEDNTKKKKKKKKIRLNINYLLLLLLLKYLSYLGLVNDKNKIKNSTKYDRNYLRN